MAFAPIALFAYNRPDHLRRTLAALQTCPLARKSDLYVFSDAPRSAEDRRPVDRVRELLRGLGGFGHVEVIHQEVNLGLARSIIGGVTDLCDVHGRVIVLEDDLVVAPGFLAFMNQALDRYQDEPKVMQVSGYMFPIARAAELGNTFLCRVPASWGWATWSRAWACLDLDSERLFNLLAVNSRQYEFDVNGSYPYFSDLQRQIEGKIDVWGVRWYASMFVKGGFCLYPTCSLVRNIGMDGSGIHCGSSTVFDVELSHNESWEFTERIEESQLGVEFVSGFFSEIQGGGRTNVITQVFSRLGSAARRVKMFGERVVDRSR